MEFEATNAALSAQIANEKILTVEANEEIANGTAQRQAVLIQARERDVRKSDEQAGDAVRQATASQARVDSLETELADLKLKKTERGLVLTLGDVLFDTGQATMKPGAYATLDRLATALRQQSERKVLIEGHTDNVGSSPCGQLDRARVVAGCKITGWDPRLTEIIELCVRWYITYRLSYRNLAAMMAERGVIVSAEKRRRR